MDPILYWNEVALEANRKDFTDVPPGETKPKPEQGGPTLSSRAFAIVHLAMYDAYFGIVNTLGLPPYLSGPINPPVNGADVKSATDAAIATAAHACLSALYPRQKPFFDLKHQEAGLTGAGLAAGHSFGLAVAQMLLADRASDPRADDTGYAASMHPGGHRPDPVTLGQGYHAPFYGARSQCFAATQRHSLDSPPKLGDAEYDRAVRQVRTLGIAPELMGTLPSSLTSSYPPRTAEQTLIGLYWAYDGPRELGTPPRLYNQIIRKIAMEKSNSVAENAHLFALVNAAMGDAGILAWRQKYRHNVWRPVLGIREHDGSIGPAAPTPADSVNQDCDPLWLPLGAPASNSTDPNFTPPFPAYPSGHATFGAAALHMVRLFYKGKPGITVEDNGPDNIFTGPFVSDELNGLNRDNKGIVRVRHVRHFPRGLWQMIEENGFSRVYLGVHWFFDAFALDCEGKPDLNQKRIGGVPLGLRIAEDIFKNGLRKAPKKP